MKTTSLIFVFLITIFTAFGQPTTGLIAHWNMNGSTNDVSGNGNNGTGSNIIPAIGEDGIMGHAYYFNGVNSSISIPYSPMFNVSAYTISAYVKVMGFYTGPCADNMILVRGKTGLGNCVYVLSFSSQPAGFGCTGYDTTQEVFCSGSSAPSATLSPYSFSSYNYTPYVIENQWYNVVVTFNDTLYQTYINGILMDTAYIINPGLALATGTDGISIGYDINEAGTGYPYPFNGVIDDILLYNRVLTTSEIAQISNPTGIMTLNSLSFWDMAHNCIYDSTIDPLVTIPVTFEVDSNNIAIDTIPATSGFYYAPNGNVGDIYTFKAISVPLGITLTCPPSGIIYDTISAVTNNYPVRNLGFICSGSTDFDLSVNAELIAGRHLAQACILVNNPYCDSVAATLTMNFDPKYVFADAVPAPSSVSGNTITWNFPAVSSFTPSIVDVHLQVPGAWLIEGDTVTTSYSITPITGDTNPDNNNCVIIDTVKGSYDPNEMSVNPSGTIPAGTPLAYTISFENTGNDTAFNISISDTLSDNVNVKSLNIVTASAVMNTGIDNGGHNIVSFNFPNINLLDSSHHGHCDGMVVFTVNTLNGLPVGSTIFNHAGIFFDSNPVVMTDTVENIIGFPEKISTLNSNNIQIFPNPVTKEITIYSIEKITNIAITNLIGQTVYTHEYNTQQVQVDVSGFTSGLYFVKVNGNEMRKFVKD